MDREANIANLYRRPIESKRTGALYNAFSYATKIDPEAVAVFLAAHTSPGATVFDPFGGSGSTGIAAALCDRPTDRMRALAADAGVVPVWGPRHAVLYELSPLGALLAKVMTDPPDPAAFRAAALALLADTDRSFGWAYAARAPDGRPGHIRHIIWSEVLEPPCCGQPLTFWDAAVTLDPVALAKTFRCPACGQTVAAADCARSVHQGVDPVLGQPTARRDWRPACVYGSSPGGTWSRAPTHEDIDLIARVGASPVVGSVPTDPIYWGDLYRSGYHTGIERFHHLYTDRNLRALARLWRGVALHPPALQDALKLLILSYTATHSSVLTRVVVKKEQRDFVITGAQSGVLYVSGLPVEKNVFVGIRRKVKTFTDAFRLTHGSGSRVRVVHGSSTRVDLADASVDYVFTDPPFGAFIPYAEVNQVNEAWLGTLTDRTEEAIISPAQGKDVDAYGQLLNRVFAETARVLRPDGAATVVFHASKPEVWQAVGDAFRQNGFEVERTSVLDKSQVSFKQVVHEGGTRDDAVFLLRPSPVPAGAVGDTRALDLTIDLLLAAAGDDRRERAPRRLYSRYVAHCIENAVDVAITSSDFYAHLAARRAGTP